MWHIYCWRVCKVHWNMGLLLFVPEATTYYKIYGGTVIRLCQSLFLFFLFFCLFSLPWCSLSQLVTDSLSRKSELTQEIARYDLSCSHYLISSFFNSGGGEGSLDRLLPSVNTSLSPRKRTTSQCKSEPPLLRTSKRTIYTAGRPPWYNEHGTQSKEAFVIGQYIRALQRGKINTNSYAIAIIVDRCQYTGVFYR